MNSQQTTQPDAQPDTQHASNQPEPMRVFNVAVPVVACVNASDASDAYRRVETALRAAGFEPMETCTLPEREYTVDPPFEAETGTEATL